MHGLLRAVYVSWATLQQANDAVADMSQVVLRVGPLPLLLPIEDTADGVDDGGHDGSQRALAEAEMGAGDADGTDPTQK